LYPYNDLLIYEMGAGNGTLMLNILDHIRDAYPEVYERTRYSIIEISPQLAAQQQHRLRRAAADRGHHDKVSIVNRSIFDWDAYVASPCFFLAMEVFDNFAHDCVRYDPRTDAALQSTVLVDARGDFHDFYAPRLDPLAARFLRTRAAAVPPPAQRHLNHHPLAAPRAWRRLRAALPFAPNLSAPEYLPTRLLSFFDVLHNYFPAHRLLASDFHSLPDAVEGFNAPVVQTRYQRRTIPVSTPLVSLFFFCSAPARTLQS
ncbi:MAG: SAM-dependent methyltransferase, partial [Terriglobus roseus]|nr:SAM-dependent methyltransferase [Terriglobus roseus]